MAGNIQAPWDPIWRYILDEHSDDESTLESDDPKRGKHVRFNIPGRARSAPKSQDQKPLVVKDNDPAWSLKHHQAIRKSQDKEKSRNWFDRSKKPPTETRTEVSSTRNKVTNARDQTNNEASARSVLDLMKLSMFNEDYTELYDSDSGRGDGSDLGASPSRSRDGSDTLSDELQNWGYLDPSDSIRESLDDSTIRSDGSEETMNTAESEFSKFVVNRAVIESATEPTSPNYRRPASPQKKQAMSPTTPTSVIITSESGRIKTTSPTQPKGRTDGSVGRDVSSSRGQKDLSGSDELRDDAFISSEATDFDRFIEMEMERMALERKRGIGRVACCSVKGLFEEDAKTLLGRSSKSTSAYRFKLIDDPEQEKPRRCFGGKVSQAPDYPVVRLVADKEGPQQVVTTNRSITSEFLPPDDIANRKGPQSVFEYEYDSGLPMDVVYQRFGDDPRSQIRTRQFGAKESVPLESDDVLIKVEASTVSPTDCTIRRGHWWKDDAVPLPCTPGVDLLGKIDQVHPRVASRFKLKVGERVMSLVQWGGNSRYARVSPTTLVKVPHDVDPAQAVCLAESFLAAFKALHIGQRSGQRYRKNSLAGKSILIVGAMSNVGRAVLELAREAGAKTVYAIGKDKQHPRLKELGGLPLGKQVESWLPHVEKRMDLVIDASGDRAVQTVSAHYFKALNEQGHLVFIGQPVNSEAIASQLSKTSKILCTTKANSEARDRIHYLDVFESWSTDVDRSKSDLGHLLELLQRKAIEPVVLDRIPLAKIGRAHETLEIKRLHGFLVCEPWIKTKQRALYL